MNWPRLCLLTLAVPHLLLVGCAGATTTQLHDPQGTWRVESLEVDRAIVDLDDSPVVFEVSDSQVKARLACNTWTARRSDGDALAADPITTDQGCTPRASEADRASTLALISATDYEVDDDKMVLTGPDLRLVLLRE